MANATALKIIADGHNNAIAQLTGVLDTSNVSIAPAIVIADFTANDPKMKAILGFQIASIQFSVGSQLQIQLQWQATTPQLIAGIQDVGELCYESLGGIRPVTGAAGFNGAINLITTGWASGTQLYTVVLFMQKLYTVS
jgi:hypothetical protein